MTDLTGRATQARLESATWRLRKSLALWPLLFAAAAVLRFSAVIPFVIDDDEAWWSSASRSLARLGDYYLSEADHKPPGIGWFYWLIDHVFGASPEPRVARAVYVVLTILTGLSVGWLARFFSHARGADGETSRAAGWCAGTLFLLGTVMACPKLLSVTSDGLLVILVVTAYLLALAAPAGPVLSTILAGALLGAGTMVKQNGVFFLPPLVLARWPRRWNLRELAGFAAGFAAAAIPTVAVTHPEEFFFWNWTYPREVLIHARTGLFLSTHEMLVSAAWFSVALVPMLAACARASRRSPAGWRDLRVLWLLFGLAALAVVRGLFMHYWLLIVAPVSLLAAEELAGRPSPRAVAWLAAGYAAACLIIATPGSGVFWGTDLAYFERVGTEIRRNTPQGEKAMVWGGSALPLAYAGVKHPTRFVLPRFAEPPYGDARTLALFHDELLREPPALIVDLHERGDNRFDNPLDSDPFIADFVARGYRLYVDPGVPWTKYYLRAATAPARDSALRPILGARALRRVYEPFPAERQPWLKLLADAPSSLNVVLERDLNLRARAAHELLDVQGPVLSASGLPPLPLESPLWWAQVAVVQLQPKAGIKAATSASSTAKQPRPAGATTLQ